MRIAISGSTGLIGTALAKCLQHERAEVLRLVRRPAKSTGEAQWDPLAGPGGLDPAVLSGIDAVVHLAGAPIASRRWTDARKQELRASRIKAIAASRIQRQRVLGGQTAPCSEGRSAWAVLFPPVPAG